jgi:threonyl-tRNA synthetase
MHAADKGLNTVIEYGEAAFMVQSWFWVKMLGKTMATGTNSDYNLPERFDLTYKGSTNYIDL